MTERYLSLYEELHATLDVSKEAYVRYLFKRLRTLVLEHFPGIMEHSPQAIPLFQA